MHSRALAGNTQEKIQISLSPSARLRHVIACRRRCRCRRRRRRRRHRRRRHQPLCATCIRKFAAAAAVPASRGFLARILAARLTRWLDTR